MAYEYDMLWRIFPSRFMKYVAKQNRCWLLVEFIVAPGSPEFQYNQEPLVKENCSCQSLPNSRPVCRCHFCHPLLETGEVVAQEAEYWLTHGVANPCL